MGVGMTCVESSFTSRWKLIGISLAATVFSLVLACSGSLGEDSTGCGYEAFTDSASSNVSPTTDELSGFDYFVLVEAVEYRAGAVNPGLLNSVSVEESVFGTVGVGSVLELASSAGICLEPGREYYLLLNDLPGSGTMEVAAWGIFPVINNRITLSQSLRKDDVIGRFHGLDPVLFKRRFVEFVGRTDITVD
jgi:hypothetical protein